MIESEAEQHKRMAELWESRAVQAERHVELLTDQILVLEQQPQPQFHTPQQEEEVKPPGEKAEAGKNPGGTRLPEGPPPDEEWPCAENDWVVDGISYKPAWARGRSASRGERRAPGAPPWTRSRSTSKEAGAGCRKEEGHGGGAGTKEGAGKTKDRVEVKELPNESGRATELPQLVDDGSPLTFGDWMATIEHNMKDISTYSAMWWEDVCDSAKVAYAEWLVASPLERLRIKPELPVVCLDLPRTEQRGGHGLEGPPGAGEEGAGGEQAAQHGEHHLQAVHPVSAGRSIREAADPEQGRKRLGGSQTVEGLEALAEESVGPGSGSAGRYAAGVGPGQVCGGIVEVGSAEQLPDVNGEGRAEPGY